MDNKKLVGGESAESLMLEGFKMVGRDEPTRVHELKTPLIGVYKSVGKSTHSELYNIETENGVVKLFGCADLDSQMCKIKIGLTVAIVYKGSYTTQNGNKMSRCQVYVK